MSDPIADIIEDYRAFAAMQRDRLVARGSRIELIPPVHQRVYRTVWCASVQE